MSSKQINTDENKLYGNVDFLKNDKIQINNLKSNDFKIKKVFIKINNDFVKFLIMT